MVAEGAYARSFPGLGLGLRPHPSLVKSYRRACFMYIILSSVYNEVVITFGSSDC